MGGRNRAGFRRESRLADMSAAVVVTGAASGIGAAITARLDRAGWSVVLVDQDEAGLQDVAARLTGLSKVVSGDVRDAATHERAALEARGLGPLMGWVNCAGVSRPTPLLECTEDDLRAVFDVNFAGTVWGCASAVRAMLAQPESGAIVNISSVHGIRAYPDHPLYEASKAAIDALTRSVGVTYADQGVRCTAVAPGGVLTPALQASIDSAANPAGALDELLDMVPAGRLAAAAEIAEIVLFLLSPSASYITAQTIVADGAMTSHLGFRTGDDTKRSE